MNVMTRILSTTLLCCLASPSLLALPLFDEESTLELTIEAPLRELIRKQLDNPVYDTVVRYTDSSGQERTLKGQLTSRGNSRLDACDFPPLRLVLSTQDTGGTVFEGQKRLKIVTQCDKSKDAESWLLQELGIYRAYSKLTPYSFRVRRLNVTYVDSESSRWTRTQPAFFIEPIGEVATRLQHDAIRPPVIEPAQYHEEELTKNMLFQMLIANTDFSIKRGPRGEGCCHNGRVLTEPGQQTGWIIVPYDFDQAGIINTEYAIPDRRLGIRAVTSRLYRGFCWQNDSLPDAIDRFRERRDDITAMLVPTELSATRQKRVRHFVDGFYEILNNPAELQKRIVDKCRGPDTFPIRKTTTSED